MRLNKGMMVPMAKKDNIETEVEDSDIERIIIP